MTKKIGFTGTHGSGKSTLANKIAERLKQKNHTVSQIGSIARGCPFPINEKTSIEAQIWILSERIRREINEVGLCELDYTLCERTVVDDLAYYKRMSDTAALDTDGDSFETDIWKCGPKKYTFNELIGYDEFYKSAVENWIGTYDQIFFLEPLPLVKDGVRPEAEEFQKDISDRILQFLTDNRISYHKIPVASIEERANEVMELLK